MRVLVVVHGLPPYAQGGSEIYAESLARELHRRHADAVHVLTREADSSRDDYATRTERRDGLTITWVNNTFRRIASFSESYANARIDAAAVRVIDEFKPDVAHVHHLTCLSTTIVDRLAERGVPVCYTLHDYWLLCHRGQLLDTELRPCDGPEPAGCHSCLGWSSETRASVRGAAVAFNAIEKRMPRPMAAAMRRAATRVARLLAKPEQGVDEARARFDHFKAMAADVPMFLAPSRSIHDRFRAFGIAADRIAVHRLGFDSTAFRAHARVPSDVLRIGFIGSLMVSKAPHVVLEAFGRLPAGRATLDLFGEAVPYHGDDSYKERLAPLLRTAGVRTRGGVAHDAIPAALAGLDVVVMPSIWRENSPLVIHEALMSGAPVVASDIGGMGEMIDHGVNGLLFKPGDVDDLHRQLRRLLDEPDLLPALRAGIRPGRTLADDADATRQIYESLIRKPRGVSTPPTRVAAVVLNYGAPDDTSLAVRSLLRSSRELDRIVVVDNDQSGACRQALASLVGRVTYIQNGTNLGFSGGMNVGIREALAGGADVVVLVNSDLIVPPPCLERLLRTLARTPGAGIAGPAILSRSYPDQIASLGMTWHPGSGRMWHSGAGEPASRLASREIRRVDGLSGCLMMIKREVLERIGLLEVEYFFSFEDLEFCLRASRAGFASVVDPGAVAFHEGGRSIGQVSPRRLYFAARNHLRLANQAQPGVVSRAFRSTSVVALNVAHAVRAPGGTLAARLAAVARGTRDYVTGRFGDG